MTRELGVVSVSQAYDRAKGGVVGWRLWCCGRHSVGLDCVILAQGGCVVLLYTSNER